MFQLLFYAFNMWTLMILLFYCTLPLISAQYDSQPMAMQPVPIVFKLPYSTQQNPMGQQNSLISNDNTQDITNDRFFGNGINNFRPNTRRYDSPIEMPIKTFEGDKARNSRYLERHNSYFSQRPEVLRSWEPSRYSEQRPRATKYSRKDALSVHKSILKEEKIPSPAEIRRSPRVVKYIADKNGFALREDLVQPLQNTIARSRQNTRILTAASSPLMSKVVTSAIRVSSNNQPESSGKFLPQIFDLKVGI